MSWQINQSKPVFFAPPAKRANLWRFHEPQAIGWDVKVVTINSCQPSQHSWHNILWMTKTTENIQKTTKNMAWNFSAKAEHTQTLHGQAFDHTSLGEMEGVIDGRQLWPLDTTKTWQDPPAFLVHYMRGLDSLDCSEDLCDPSESLLLCWRRKSREHSSSREGCAETKLRGSQSE